MDMEVDICNAALAQLGQERIQNLSDLNKRARACNDRYAGVRDAVLRAAKWRCAIKRVTLDSPLSTAPAFGWAYAFQLPSDYIRHAFSDDALNTFRIEDGKLLTNYATFNLAYVYRLTEVPKMDTLLAEAIAARLAFEIGPQIHAGLEGRKLAGEIYEAKLAEAMQVSAEEDMVQTTDVFQSNWVQAMTGRTQAYSAIDTGEEA